VVAVGVVAGEPAELVPGQLGGLLVMRGGVLGGSGGRQRGELEQRARGGRAVQAAVGDDGALVGALRPAVTFPD
jgi:hypothetical protein